MPERTDTERLDWLDRHWGGANMDFWMDAPGHYSIQTEAGHGSGPERIVSGCDLRDCIDGLMNTEPQQSSGRDGNG